MEGKDRDRLLPIQILNFKGGITAKSDLHFLHAMQRPQQIGSLHFRIEDEFRSLLDSIEGLIAVNASKFPIK